MAKGSLRAEAARNRISDRLGQLQDDVDEAQFERDLVKDELAAEQRERAAAEEDRATAEWRLRHVQTELAKLGRVDLAWSEPDVDVRDIRPDSFIELLGRLGDLTYVLFTGEADITESLDRHGAARSWAGKTWDALLALDDYARLSITGTYARDVTGYLNETPVGCRGFSGNRHAATESDSVQQNPKFRKPRELPVPTQYEMTGSAFMGAHFKIANSAMISPRVHYIDALARTRRIYVGYIGPHLPTSDS